MNKLLLIITISGLIYSSTCLSQSQIKNVKIVNKSLNSNTVNAAIGSGSTANVGSINIKGKVSNMKVTNKSINVGTINAAIGGGTSNSGSINIQ